MRRAGGSGYVHCATVGVTVGMANRPTDAQRMANQAQQLRDWTSQLRSEDSTVQQLALLRQFVAEDGNSDAVEWLLERVLEHTTVAEKAAAPAPTDEEILSELSPLHLDNLLTEAERNQFEIEGVRAHYIGLVTRLFLLLHPLSNLMSHVSLDRSCIARSSLWSSRRYHSRWSQNCKESLRTWRLSTVRGWISRLTSD